MGRAQGLAAATNLLVPPATRRGPGLARPQFGVAPPMRTSADAYGSAQRLEELAALIATQREQVTQTERELAEAEERASWSEGRRERLAGALRGVAGLTVDSYRIGKLTKYRLSYTDRDRLNDAKTTVGELRDTARSEEERATLASFAATLGEQSGMIGYARLHRSSVDFAIRAMQTSAHDLARPLASDYAEWAAQAADRSDKLRAQLTVQRHALTQLTVERELSPVASTAVGDLVRVAVAPQSELAMLFADGRIKALSDGLRAVASGPLRDSGDAQAAVSLADALDDLRSTLWDASAEHHGGRAARLAVQAALLAGMVTRAGHIKDAAPGPDGFAAAFGSRRGQDTAQDVAARLPDDVPRDRAYKALAALGLIGEDTTIAWP